jgi:hypothetical protein
MIEARFELIYPNSTLPGSEFINIICGFPGSGYAGKLAVDHLIYLSAKNLVDIYSNTLPAQVQIKAGGSVIPFRNTIFYHESTISPSSNIMFLTGDSQPSNPDAEYLSAETILGIVSKLSVLPYTHWQLLSQEFLSRNLEYFVRLATWKELDVNILEIAVMDG